METSSLMGMNVAKLVVEEWTEGKEANGAEAEIAETNENLGKPSKGDDRSRQAL